MLMKPCCITALGLLAVAAVSAAFAQDSGPFIEISAACVPEGCFETDPPGLPVLITEPGHYRLTSDLESDGTTSVIVVQMQNELFRRGVHLDLGGHVLRGPFSCIGTPVSSCNTAVTSVPAIRFEVRNGSLRNGTIRGFAGPGVLALLLESGLIEGLMVTDNASHGIEMIDVVSNEGYVIRDNILHRNGGDGLRAPQGDFGHALISGNLATGNHMAGLRIGRGARAADNIAVNNASFGIMPWSVLSPDGQNCLVSGNVLFGNNNDDAQMNCSASNQTNQCNSGAC
jgi:hypothetical protein